MGPDVRNTLADRDRERDAIDVTRPTVVMIERGSHVRSGQLVELGRQHARIRTQQSLRNGETLVLTVSVNESSSEKTQAMFRLTSQVRRKSDDASPHDYFVQFSTDNENLDNAKKLYARIRSRGIDEV